MIRYAQSLALIDQALKVTPLSAQTMSKAPSRFVQGAMPAFLKRGHGCCVWDIDGNEFVDWICALGPITLGYGHPAVQESVERQVKDGPIFSLPTRLETEVAERLIEIIPCAEMVRFVMTGTEATEAAIRTARMATGRDVILSCGYHGWTSQWAAVCPIRDGVPRQLTETIMEIPYNRLPELDTWFDPEPEAIAAVMIEPVLFEPPTPGYLRGLREWCDRHSVLLIFDEVVTGFRWALGGAQEYFGVMPDLATFGKGMANGYPVAALVGRADLMRHAWTASGTFSGWPVSLAAAKATIDEYRKHPSLWHGATCVASCDRTVIGHMWGVGRALMDGFNCAARALGIPARMEGYPVHPRVVFDLPSGQHVSPNLAMSLLLQELAARGVLFHPSGLNTCLAHDAAALSKTLTACREALAEVKAGMEARDLAGRLRGTPIDESLQVRADSGHGRG